MQLTSLMNFTINIPSTNVRKRKPKKENVWLESFRKRKRKRKKKRKRESKKETRAS